MACGSRHNFEGQVRCNISALQLQGIPDRLSPHAVTISMGKVSTPLRLPCDGVVASAKG